MVMDFSNPTNQNTGVAGASFDWSGMLGQLIKTGGQILENKTTPKPILTTLPNGGSVVTQGGKVLANTANASAFNGGPIVLILGGLVLWKLFS